MSELSEDKEKYRTFFLNKEGGLRYGENPHQSASLYKHNEIADYDFLNGKRAFI